MGSGHGVGMGYGVVGVVQASEWVGVVGLSG